MIECSRTLRRRTAISSSWASTRALDDGRVFALQGPLRRLRQGVLALCGGNQDDMHLEIAQVVLGRAIGLARKPAQFVDLQAGADDRAMILVFDIP
ncbi:MAG: hypothetical protein N838_23815 [Thiohalocapsa sp. PB-PSB1]|nr:MAG: hypothetical protein N838_23815 [Thiohalocapsa sp. PB-PSB1]